MTRKHIGLAADLLLLYFALSWSTWRGNTQLHTISEVIATILALIVGLVALVRFYTKKNNTYLFIGAGFIGTALLDGYHAVVTSTFFQVLFPSPAPSLIPWSWNASRTFLALLLVLSVWAYRREQTLKDEGRIGEGAVYFGVGVLTVLSFYFFAFVPLPRAYYPELFFGRPEEFISAALFLLAAAGYIKKGDWRHDPFENMVVLSLIVGFMGQAVFMSRSFGLFDTMFDAAHLLKFVSYGIVLAGLLVNMYHIYREAGRPMVQLGDLNHWLERERSLLRSLLDNLPDYVFVKDRDCRFVTANRAHLNLLDARHVDDVAGKTDLDLFPSDLAERYYADDREVIRSGKTLPYRVEEALDLQGNRQWLLTTKVPLKDAGGQVTGLVGIARDITPLKQIEEDLALENEERQRAQEELTQTVRDLAEAKDVSEKQAEELAKANAELEQFAYAASHDLKEPVRNLVSYSTLLREDLGEDISDDAAMDLEYISGAAKRMGNLVDGLLSLSRVGRSSLKREPVLIENCVTESLEALRTRVLESGSQVEWDTLPEVIGDSFLLTQLYQNLLANAMKFIESEPPSIRLTAEQAGDVWTLGVRDNGIGIDPQYAEQIFAPFKRLHGITEFEGTGIGLALCRKTIERHGGKIWVESEPGKGAHFKFTLPAAKGDQS